MWSFACYFYTCDTCSLLFSLWLYPLNKIVMNENSRKKRDISGRLKVVSWQPTGTEQVNVYSKESHPFHALHCCPLKISGLDGTGKEESKTHSIPGTLMTTTKKTNLPRDLKKTESKECILNLVLRICRLSLSYYYRPSYYYHFDLECFASMISPPRSFQSVF